jgi:hypothetical protein
VPLLYSCNSNQSSNKESKQESRAQLYYGGDIITMEGDNATYAEALVIKDGKIVYVGKKSDAEQEAGNEAELIDLMGKTLVPGFIDGYAHFFGFGA